MKIGTHNSATGRSSATIRNWIKFGMIPNDPADIKILSEVTGIPENKLWSNENTSLIDYCNPQHIRISLNKFFKGLYAKEKNTPYNLLFLGDSITNSKRDSILL